MILLGLGTVVVMLASKAWPGLAIPIWGVFLVAVAALICLDVRDPVNYESMHISGGVVEYVVAGERTVIPIAEIVRLEFVREEALFPDLYGPYIESKWLVHLADGARVEVMDEWPHRAALLRAFTAHLQDFRQEAALAGTTAKGDGRWLCYEAAQLVEIRQDLESR